MVTQGTDNSKEGGGALVTTKTTHPPFPTLSTSLSPCPFFRDALRIVFKGWTSHHRDGHEHWPGRMATQGTDNSKKGDGASVTTLSHPPPYLLLLTSLPLCPFFWDAWGIHAHTTLKYAQNAHSPSNIDLHLYGSFLLYSSLGCRWCSSSNFPIWPPPPRSCLRGKNLCRGSRQ